MRRKALGRAGGRGAWRRPSSAVCGCILGKPLEFNADLATIRAGLEALDEWPLADYIPERAERQFGREMPYWNRTYRERIRYVMPDDDINYIVLGMLLLEEHGADLRTAHVRDAWLKHLPLASTFGPERMTLVKAGIAFLGDVAGADEEDDGDEGGMARWPALLNRGRCAARRSPRLRLRLPRPAWAGGATRLAGRQLTHRRTGVYATMFTAAAIAAAAGARALQAVETALRFVPQRSRFRGDVRLSARGAPGDGLPGRVRAHPTAAMGSIRTAASTRRSAR